MTVAPSERAYKPTRIHSPRGGLVTTITWGDGHSCRYEHRLLRGYCPCAGCQGHDGPIRYLERSERQLELDDILAVGNYALQLRWFDDHDSGIYSFRYLRGLCAYQTLLDEGAALPVIGRNGLPSVGE
jgi:DUF971 family protein